MTMLEKMCRALCLEAGLDPDRKFKSANWGPETAPHEFAWQEYLPAARAALLAIREPDDAMLAPACKTHKPGEPMSEARPYECPSITRRRARFTAMIDAILEGEA
jgi:hypothetical protein